MVLLLSASTLFYTVSTGSILFLIGYIWNFKSKKEQHPAKKEVYLNGVVSSFPRNRYLQTQMRDMFIQNYCGGKKNVRSEDLNFIERLFAKTLIDTCYVDLPYERLFERMNRITYTTYVKSALLDMACGAATDVLSKLSLKPHDITHLAFGTMTGTIHAPSIDISIAQKLGLAAPVKRLNVESMGCLTGFRLVGLCQDIAAANEQNIVLLIVCDIRSALGNQLPPFTPMEPIDRQNVIISALFRDAGGAAVFSQKRRKNADLCVLEHRSALLPNSIELARLHEFNDGAIHLFLDKELPVAVFNHVPALVTELLTKHSIDLSQCLFAVHTGGPKIINGIQECLKLKREQLFASWYVMKKYGNLSGSSNLVVLDHIMSLRKGTHADISDDISIPSDFSKYSHIIGISFGPGVGVEYVLLQM